MRRALTLSLSCWITHVGASLSIVLSVSAFGKVCVSSSMPDTSSFQHRNPGRHKVSACNSYNASGHLLCSARTTLLIRVPLREDRRHHVHRELDWLLTSCALYVGSMHTQAVLWYSSSQPRRHVWKTENRKYLRITKVRKYESNILDFRQVWTA